jgi:hypothetical protein
MLPRDVREALIACEAVLSQLKGNLPRPGTARSIMIQGFTVAAIAEARAVLAKDHRSREDLWSDDSIQFTRLVAEIAAMGLADEDRAELCGRLDLEGEELQELFQRAETTWEQMKRELLPRYNPRPDQPMIRR